MLLKRFQPHLIVLLTLVLLLGASALNAQTAATLTGTVIDSTDAVVPGVKITLKNPETGETYTASTNEAGAYTIPFIKPGTYELTAQAAGFKQHSRPGVRMETTASARADISLELGELTEVVTVEASLPLLKTSNSSVGAVIRNKTIANMPLINRRAAQLVRLNGFVVQNGNGSQFMMAGGRGNNAMWTLDGGSTQNILLGVASLNFDPPIEALEEFSVEISNYKAEMGRSGGGFVQMTTKSGTNEFHGALYEFIRNDAMDSRQFFAADKQKLRRNQFGGALGGPIVKDRTFFFVSQEFQRQKTSNPRFESLPSPAELQGDFSGRKATIKDPVTGDPVPNKIIPQSQIDPVGLAVAGFFPAPNVSGRGSRNRNYLGLASEDRPTDTLSVRMDHAFTDKHRVYGRYVHDLGTSEEGAGIWPTPVHNNHRFVESEYFNWSVTGISTISSKLIAEYRFTWNKRKFHPTIAAKGLGLADQIGIKGVDPEFFPGFRFTGGIQGIGRTGGQERRQFPIRDNHFVTNWTYIAGNHTLKWGGEMRASQNDDQNLPRAGGAFNFNSNGTGDSIAALLYGWTNRGRRQQTFLIRSRANSMGLYVQDDWKVSPKLTLNLGLRHDLDTPRWEKINNRQNSFDAEAVNPVCGCPGVITWSGRDARGGSKYAHNFVNTNFGPRLGFAYRASDNWIIRGGASIIYSGQYDQATPFVTNAGFSVQGDFRASTPAGAALLLKDGLPAIREPTEADLVPGFGAAPIGGKTIFSPQFFQPEGRPNPYLITYNFNIQRMLPWDALFEVGYLSTFGKKLTIPGNMTVNQVHPTQIHLVDDAGVTPQSLRPFPQFSNVVMMSPTVGSSAYHGVNFRLEKRYSSGLLFSMNYTFARALDDVESRDELGGETGNVPFSNQYDRRIAWGLAGNHIKHRYITSVVWDIPWGKGRARSFSNAALNQIAGGWTVGTIIEARTGPPFGAIFGNAGRVYPTAARIRAQIDGEYGKNDAWRDNVRGETFFDTSNFSRPDRFTFGNVGRNFQTGPGALRADLSVLKEIYMPLEGHSLQFRAELINFPNRANFSLPNNDSNSPAFGTINSLTAGASGRIIQLGLRYAF